MKKVPHILNCVQKHLYNILSENVFFLFDLPSYQHEYRHAQAEYQEYRHEPCVFVFSLRRFHLCPEVLHLLVRFVGKIYEHGGVLADKILVGVGFGVILSRLVRGGVADVVDVRVGDVRLAHEVYIHLGCFLLLRARGYAHSVDEKVSAALRYHEA